MCNNQIHISDLRFAMCTVIEVIQINAIVIESDGKIGIDFSYKNKDEI